MSLNKMRQLRWLWLWLILLSLIPSSPLAAAEPNGEPLYFKETGHTLAYNFRVFWQENGGLAIFGFPLTEVFVEQGRPVQYFERAKLEWHAPKGQVLAGQLGTWAARDYLNHPAFTRVEGRTNDNQDYFAESGHTLAGAFQQFWYKNGGLKVFGFPISEEFQELNPQTEQPYLVQYFERAKFELQFNKEGGFQVKLALLGKQYLEMEKPAPTSALAAVTGAENAWDGLRPTRVALPRLNLDTEIVEGGFSFDSWFVPRYTAVHYWPVAAFPGTSGNNIIAGHSGYRNTIFDRLPQAQIDDEIIIWTGQQARHYRVTTIWTVLPNATWVMSPTNDEILTLITCVPPDVYSHRLIVRATPVL